MSSLENVSRIRSVAGLLAAVLPLLCVSPAGAGEPARAAASSEDEAPRAYLEAGDALGLEIFAGDLPRSDSAAQQTRREPPTRPAENMLAGEAPPAAPDPSASH